MVFFKRIPLLKQLQSTINSNKCNKKNIFTNTLELIYINSRASNELKKEIEALHEVKNRLHRKEQELSEQSQILFKKENLLISQKNGLKEKEEEIAKYINKVFEQQEQEKIIKFIVGIIRESLELDKVLEKTVEEIGRLINADRCLIGIFEESEQKFELLNEYKSEPNLVSILDYQNEARLNKENLYQLVNRKKPIIINDSQKGQVSSNLNPFIELYEIKSYAIIPLIHKKEVLGIIIVCQTKTQREWKENHIELLSDIGSQIGIAIKQAYLHKQLQEATNLKSQFLANMSHEFRTPLNAIIGFSEMLLTGNYGDLTSKQLEYLKNISISGKHLLRLVGDILDLSKVESGKMQLNNERFDAKHIINETIALLSNQASPKDIEIITTIEQVYLYTDIRIFRQIIFNLLSNAIKFTENGGAITINSKLINNKLITEIIDTGIGIPDKDKDKIFKQFTQLDSSYSRKQEGTGLGLALTKKLVELQNGEINFESEEGTGSRFWFELSCIDTPVKEYTNI
ncbi:MAG: ATP-binding protein [bacterium]